MIHRKIPLAFIAITAFALSACTGPQKYIDNAEVIINQSRKVNADKYSPQKLKKAQEHLAKAMQAQGEKDDEKVIEYAMQAEQIGFDAYYVAIENFVADYHERLKEVRQNALRHEADKVAKEKFQKGEELFNSINADLDKVEKLKKAYQQGVADRESLQEKNKKRKKIVSNLKSVRENSKKALRFFSDAAETAIQLEKSAKDKMDKLASAIQAAKKGPATKNGRVKSAENLQDRAQKEFKNYEYAKAEDSAAEGLHKLSKRPFVTLRLNNHLFSPGDSNPNDEIELQTRVFSVNEVAGYEISIHTVEGKEGESLVKQWSGEGMPPETVDWDGENEDGTVVASSAEDYFVRLKVMDSEENEAVSRDVKFKTDIFAHNTDRGLVMDVSSIRFAYNKSNLTSEDRKIAEKVRDYLREFPDYRVVIEGHTDATGSAESNRSLARERAQSVADYMQKLGLNKDRITTYGMGEVLPLTRDSRKIGINRRVSFILLKEKGDLEAYEEFRNSKDLDRGIIMENTEALSDYPPTQN